MPDATTVPRHRRSLRPGGSGGTAASGAVKTRPKTEDFAAGAAMLTPRVPVQHEPVADAAKPSATAQAQHDIGQVASFLAALRTLGNALDP